MPSAAEDPRVKQQSNQQIYHHACDASAALGMTI